MYAADNLKLKCPLVQEKAFNLKNCFLKILENKKSDIIECSDLIARYTTDVVSVCVFGIESTSLGNPNSPLRQFCKTCCANDSIQIRIMLNTLFPKLSRKLSVKKFPKYLIDSFNDLIEDSLRHKEGYNTKKRNFVDNLLELGKEDNECKIINWKNVTAKRSIAAMEFFLVGYETSTNALIFTLHELSKNQKNQSSAREDVKQVLLEHNGQITLEATMQMKYLNACINGKEDS